jgi:hypothetical protein
LAETACGEKDVVVVASASELEYIPDRRRPNQEYQ